MKEKEWSHTSQSWEKMGTFVISYDVHVPQYTIKEVFRAKDHPNKSTQYKKIWTIPERVDIWANSKGILKNDNVQNSEHRCTSPLTAATRVAYNPVSLYFSIFPKEIYSHA